MPPPEIPPPPSPPLPPSPLSPPSPSSPSSLSSGPSSAARFSISDGEILPAIPLDEAGRPLTAGPSPGKEGAAAPHAEAGGESPPPEKTGQPRESEPWGATEEAAAEPLPPRFADKETPFPKAAGEDDEKEKRPRLGAGRVIYFVLGVALRVGFYLFAIWLDTKHPFEASVLYGYLIGDFVFRTLRTVMFAELTDSFYAGVGILIMCVLGWLDPNGFFGLEGRYGQPTVLFSFLFLLLKLAAVARLPGGTVHEVF